jgi:hypothetical protein
MKSLAESIFDKGNVSSGFTFGNLYKLVDVRVISGQKWQIDKLYNTSALSRDTGVKCSNVEDTIVKSLEKLICDIPVSGNMPNKEFTTILRTYMKYYKNIVNNTIRLKACSWPGIYIISGGKDKYPDGTPYDGDIEKLSNIINNWKLLDKGVKKVEVEFLKIKFTFEKI